MKGINVLLIIEWFLFFVVSLVLVCGVWFLGLYDDFWSFCWNFLVFKRFLDKWYISSFSFGYRGWIIFGLFGRNSSFFLLGRSIGLFISIFIKIGYYVWVGYFGIMIIFWIFFCWIFCNILLIRENGGNM